jgi:hypothetical protein
LGDNDSNSANTILSEVALKTLSKDMLVERLNKQTKWTTPLEKLIVFGELGHKEKAKREFERLITETTRNPGFLETVKGYGKKYGLI